MMKENRYAETGREGETKRQGIIRRTARFNFWFNSLKFAC